MFSIRFLCIAFIYFLLSSTNVFAYTQINTGNSKNCSDNENYYSRAECILGILKKEQVNDFMKDSGIYIPYDMGVENVIKEYDKSLAKFISTVEQAKVDMTQARERSYDMIVENIKNKVAQMFVNGDDSDISKYDIVYELSKVDALLQGVDSLSRSAKGIRVLPRGYSWCDLGGGGFELCPSVNFKYYKKPKKKESENSILGHVTYMQKAVEEINNNPLFINIVPGMPFVMTDNQKMNAQSPYLNWAVEYLGVLPKEYTDDSQSAIERYRGFNPLDLRKLKSHMKALGDSGEDRTTDSDSSYKAILNNIDNICSAQGTAIVNKLEEISSDLAAQKVDNIFAKLQEVSNKYASMSIECQTMYRQVIEGLYWKTENGLLQLLEVDNLSTNLKINEQLTSTISKNAELQKEINKNIDAINITQAQGKEIDKEVVGIISEIKQISDAFSHITQYLQSWVTKPVSKCN